MGEIQGRSLARPRFILTLLGVFAGVVSVLGLVGSLAGTRVLPGFLHEVSPTDAVTFDAVAGGILVLADLAAFFPARRASGVEPLEAMRVE